MVKVVKGGLKNADNGEVDGGKIRLTDEQRMRLAHHRHLIDRMRSRLNVKEGRKDEGGNDK